MKLHRFIDKYDLSKKEVEITDLGTIKQIRAVLRLEKADKIILSDGEGREAEVVLESLSPNTITVKIEKIGHGEEPLGKVHLYLSILKKENFELAVQKAVEAGVSAITPMITERTVKTGLKFERLEKIVREASEQSMRSIVPRLHQIVNFEDAIIDGKKSRLKMIFHPKGELYKANKETGTISIFIGPEGGFTEKEIKLASENGYSAFSLGPLILRAETAAMIAAYRTANGI